MKRSLRNLVAIVVVLACAAGVHANGNGAPSGPHYNLNIIGVKHDKNPPMNNSNRHTIFVALGDNGYSVSSRIYLTAGPFAVCDGVRIQSTGAVFQLPCNVNITSENGEEIVPCDVNETAYYDVYARELGKPGGHADMTTCATDPTTGEEVCSNETLVLVRNTGKPVFKNVTKQLTSMLAGIDGDGDVERIALFAGGLQDWFWNYDNQGLKLTQLRFYLSE